MTEYFVATPATIDGKWTSADEWTDGPAITMSNSACFTYCAWMVTDVTTDWVVEIFTDNTNDTGDYWQICLDMNNDGGTAPQVDDFKIEITGHTTLKLYMGNGTSWNQIAPAQSEFTWNNSISASPRSTTPHWILEFRDSSIWNGTLQRANPPPFGMRVAAYDASSSTLAAWAPNSDANAPNKWGVVADYSMDPFLGWIASVSPANLTVAVGQSATFTVSVSDGTAPYSCQWFEGYSEMAGQTSAQLTVTKNDPGSFSYYCRVTDSNTPARTTYSNTVNLTVAPVVVDLDWPMFHHDLQHSGYSTSTAPNTNQILWTYNIGYYSVESSPAVADGKVYIGSFYSSPPLVPIGGEFICLNANSGAHIWSYNVGTISSPAVADGKVYVGSVDSKVYCLNAGSGAYIWSYMTGASIIYSSPAVADGKVYVGSSDNKTYCLNAATGEFIWSYTTGDEVLSSPAVADGKVYVGSSDGKVYCLNAANGAHVWNYTTRVAIGLSSPAVAYGKVYVGSEDGEVYCLDAANGEYIWSFNTYGSRSYFSPAVADGKVYVGSSLMYCLDAANGASIWNCSSYYGVFYNPVVADGKVYVHQNGGMYGGDGLYCFGLPKICDFDSLFKHNTARVIYPSDQTPKPLGCSPASVSDWTASAFISTKLENATEGTDTDSAFVNQVTGKPLGGRGIGIVSFGGPVVNSVVAYAESAITPISDRAPLKFYADAGTCYFQHQDGTSIPGANLPESVINSNQDMFVVESYRDGDGIYILLCYGFGWKGTYAAGKYFDSGIYPNLASATYTWTVVKWEDTNGNGFVNTAADGDTYTVIATGQ
jgi:outer membrane protein assembly factor BamB